MRPQTVRRRLAAHYGPQRWWPARTPFEMCVGAILTQHTAWSNAARAIRNLRAGRLLSARALAEADITTVAGLVRPAGHLRVKARRIVGFAGAALRAGGLGRFLTGPTDEVRRRLLALDGIGPETADAILCYAARRPAFVVDAYTMRLCGRLPIATDGTYHGTQAVFERALGRDASILGETHALIVEHAKARCRARDPRCDGCPLGRGCAEGKRRMQNY